MSELRWYLLIIGIIILLMIYLFGKRKMTASKYDVFAHAPREHHDVLLKAAEAGRKTTAATPAPKETASYVSDESRNQQFRQEPKFPAIDPDELENIPPKMVDSAQPVQQPVNEIPPPVTRIPEAQEPEAPNWQYPQAEITLEPDPAPEPISEPELATETKQPQYDTFEAPTDPGIDTSTWERPLTLADYDDEDDLQTEQRSDPSDTSPIINDPQFQQPPEAEEQAPLANDSAYIVFFIVAPKDAPFKGRAVIKSFHAHKLRFGKMDIYHRMETYDKERETLYSVANMHEPGSLVPGELVESEVKGLTLFMHLPGPREPENAYDDMLHCARHLSGTLGGILKNEQLQPLTQAHITHHRRILKQFAHDKA